MSMEIPPFAPFPRSEVRERILPRDWSAYLESWNALAELYLRVSAEEFASNLKKSNSLPDFLISFYHESANDPKLAPAVGSLRKRCLLLLHRIWHSKQVPESLLDWTFISNVSRCYPKSALWRDLLQDVRRQAGEPVVMNLSGDKADLIQALDNDKPADAEPVLDRLVILIRSSPDAGIFLLIGSDFLDSLVRAYSCSWASSSLRKKLVTIAYLGFTAMLDASKPNFSLLSDHLYTIKNDAEQAKKSGTAEKTFLADLVTNTPLLDKIREKATSPEASRVKNLAASLSEYQQSNGTRPKKLVRRKVDKGKGKAKDDEYGHGAFGEVHVHRMSLITQVQDLFPDLGSAFIVKLLDEYGDNVETVISHLLEDSLPPHLAQADRTEQLPTPPSARPHLTPRSTPPPPEIYDRRNVFDDDDFDRLAVDTSRIHIGRKNANLTADAILRDRKSAPNKSAILSALAAFDSDDDERDDTYDVEDVGGLVDSTYADDADASADKNEEALFRAYTGTPELFARDAETRRGTARAALKSETGMTDEAIEGWGIIIGRDQKRLRRLEARFSTFSGQQHELASTAYRESPAFSGEETGGQGQRGGRGGARGRGRGRGRGGGAGGGRGVGNVAGPADDKNTQASRQRKEANKGSRANHNRRDQRAKKMARGGFAG
ncbi:hypothetical protein M011DRAFT_215724 [Sporormia fimetaria CBS 119925]|uniref:CUE domain-containing protein n=1 Tax=Sporormia fimetaria CBS 119925 TaxID=1340428 RepID=A0A6A6V3A8_9PLEO|nr:hypothetical protein M011DRAFT_215724 [Sporormia fimetaria CBS 119925]